MRTAATVFRTLRTTTGDLCLNKRLVFEFIKETQPDAYSIILEKGEEKILNRIAEQIKQRRVIDVLCKGVKNFDLYIGLYYKSPAGY